MLFTFRSFFLLLLLGIPNFIWSQNIPKTVAVSDLSIGKSVQITSRILDENRLLHIYLPLSYAQDSLKEYDIIYLLDGSLDEDFIHIVGLSQFASFPWIHNISESIVVGIDNVDRKRDFTFPSKNELDQDEFPSSGGSKDFIDFLELELKPYLELNYRITEQRTIIGQSLGGLLATEILLKRPHLFNKYIIVSPSLWWDDESVLRWNAPELNSSVSTYIAVGKEGELMERTARELFDKLEHTKLPQMKLYFDYLPNKSHGDALHQAVYNAFMRME